MQRQVRKVRLAAIGASIVNCWNMVHELKKGTASSWNAREAGEQYRDVGIKEAETGGKTPPIFPYSFTGFGDDVSALGTNE